MKKIDLTGRRFGRLLVRSAADSIGGRARWLCDCDCGGTAVVQSGNLTRGHTCSCGCYQKARAAESKATHGRNRTPEHRAWLAMKTRCYNESNPSYRNYGARGITVAAEWRDDFQRFLRDMGPRPSPDHSLDRIDNEQGYAPGNCRWADRKAQARNRRTNARVVYEGVEMTLVEAAEKSGISALLLSGRRYQGRSDEELFLPLQRHPSTE